MSHTTTDQLAAVEEVTVWLEVNHTPAVTWMCTPDQLEELVVADPLGSLETHHAAGLRLVRLDLGQVEPVSVDGDTFVAGSARS